MLVLFDCCISQVVSVGIYDILFCVIEVIYCYVIFYGLVWFDCSYYVLMCSVC